MQFSNNQQQSCEKLFKDIKSTVKPSEFICIQTQQAQLKQDVDDENYLKQNDIQITNFDFKIVRTFDYLDAKYPHLTKNIQDQQWQTPSFCQQCTIMPIYNGIDTVCLSSTGSGKTGAYLIPLLMKIQDDQQFKAFVLVPSMELTMQVKDMLQSLMADKNADQCRISVSTPMHSHEYSKEKQFSTIILDEGDLLIKNYQTQLNEILKLHQNSQKVIFSATMNEKLEYLSNSFLKNPSIIKIRSSNAPTLSVNHRFIFVSKDEHKVFTLNQILNNSIPPIIVFCNDPVDLQNSLKCKYQLSICTAQMPIQNRKESLQQFIQQKTQVLITTDLLARGMDFKNVKIVIQFDAPKTYEEYIHRCGRAGRQQRGQSITFYKNIQRKQLIQTIKMLRANGESCEGFSEQFILTDKEKAKIEKQKEKKQKKVAENQEEKQEDELYADVPSEEISEK